ncbi:E3 ubiquitin-protein ligase RNF19B isoform X1 [Eleutherodactylus coqui]|uniref:E3 ubiquitin-protein ligase RNF19B isoform X1 n=1 Tax=Eleutherodactylus coqui TaxID=57060 RepID=UPI0034617BED
MTEGSAEPPPCPGARRRRLLLSLPSVFPGRTRAVPEPSVPSPPPSPPPPPAVSACAPQPPSSPGGQDSLLECPLCLVRQPPEELPELLSCRHRSCLRCLRQYLRIEITESRVNLRCPECAERLSPQHVRAILRDPQLTRKYEEFLLRRCLAADPDCRWCPAPDCGYAVIAYGCASCPRLVCEREGCQTEFCYHCKHVWHPNQTCDMARQQRAPLFGVRRKHPSGISYGQESGSADDMKSCPRCSAYIIKMNDGSCNHMTCAVCGCEFCWLCMKEISDLHYLSPSGCTFWGKKPWSKKKKIIWQLGTLIGAPVGISLIAGIAIPAMVIGIPVYVGRKIHGRFENKKTSKHKKNLAVTGGVILSVIASPVVAAVSVGIGVPIMLAYVYGVVPVSLCRGGGCGVSTANGKGVKIDFEEDGPITVADAWRALKNPSIGESSMEGLTSVLSTSGSPTDGLSVLQGNYSETASFAALSGGTLTGGTLTGGMLSGGRAKYCRYLMLEVQADVQKDTCQKDSVSLGAASDSASTRAMAGSIISSYNPQEREVNNMEIQVHIEAKPSRYQLMSESSTEESLHAGAPLVEGEEDDACRGQVTTRDITLAQPESIRSDLESSDAQSDDVPDLASEEYDSPHLLPQSPPEQRRESPPPRMCAQQEGLCAREEVLSKLEFIEVRV